MITGFESYTTYQSLKLHFTTQSYDAFKYNFKVSQKPSSYEARRDKFFFERVSRKYKTRETIVDYYSSNFVNGVKWIGDMKEDNLNDFTRKMESLTYTFETDLRKMKDSCDSFDEVCTSTVALDLNLSNEIESESIVLVDILVGFLKNLKGVIKDPMGMYSDKIETLLKYEPVVSSNLQRRSISLNKLKKTILKIYEK